MAVPESLQQVINDLTIGDEYPAKRQYGLDSPVTVATVEVLVKERFNDADDSVMPVVTITSTASASGQITNAGGPGLLLEIIFVIPYTSTSLLDSTTTYVYGVKGIDTNGFPYTFEEGKIYPNPNIGG